MPPFVTRFAPSPTGQLHLGHAYSALSAARAAKAASGRFLLRIEDIDHGRCRPEYEQAIYQDLAWLGLGWERPVRRQSVHFAEYERALGELIAQGLAYRCFKTRAEILDDIGRAPHLSAQGPEGPAYFGAPAAAHEERSLLAAGAPFAWRLSISEARRRLGPAYDALSFDVEDIDTLERRTVQATPEIFGDAVLGRKGNGASYHLASVHDDALQGVTHIVRGEDLAPAAHLHRLVQALLGFPTPVYRHHRLIADETGRRLAKRDKAATLRQLRDSGIAPREIEVLRRFCD